MKRFSRKKRSKNVQKEALENFASLKKRLEKEQPLLLEKIRQSLLDRESKDISGSYEDLLSQGSNLDIDRKKNLLTIYRFLEISQSSSEFKKQVAKLL